MPCAQRTVKARAGARRHNFFNASIMKELAARMNFIYTVLLHVYDFVAMRFVCIMSISHTLLLQFATCDIVPSKFGGALLELQ